MFKPNSCKLQMLACEKHANYMLNIYKKKKNVEHFNDGEA